jgi:hypothetical protein
MNPIVRLDRWINSQNINEQNTNIRKNIDIS